MNNVKMKTIVTRHHKQGVGDQEGGAQEAGSQGLCQDRGGQEGGCLQGGGQEGGCLQGGPQGRQQAASSSAGARPQGAHLWDVGSIPS